MTTQFFWHIGRYLRHPALGPRKKLPKSSRHNKLRASRKTSKDTKGKSLAKAWVPIGEWRRDSPLPRAATAEERGRVGARDSFITCVFGIVLRSADSTVRGLVTSCACRNFFLTPTKFSLYYESFEPGKPANVEWDPEEETSSTTLFAKFPKFSPNFGLQYSIWIYSEYNPKKLLSLSFSTPPFFLFDWIEEISTASPKFLHFISVGK